MSNRWGGRRGPLRVAAIIAACALVMLVLLLWMFRVRSIEVAGAKRQSVNTINEDLIYDYWTGNSLVLAWKYRSPVYEGRTPYLSSVQAKLLSPGKVRVTVAEKEIIGYLQYNGQNVCFDADGMVLSISDKVYDGAILVTGLTMEEPILYQRLSLSSTAVLRTMLSVTRLLRETDNLKNADSIAFDSNQNITVNLGQVSVDLGQDEYLEEKVANLSKIYPQVQGQSGQLNMSAFTGKNEQIAFREKAAELITEAVTESEADQTQTGEDAATAAEGAEAAESGETTPENGGETQEGAQEGGEEASAELTVGSGVQAFDAAGTVHNDARIVNGQVVDAYGNPIDGCSVTEEGYIKDAYWNIIDPSTGSNLNASYY